MSTKTITHDEAVERFHAELDENYPAYKIASVTVYPHEILKTDPTAYRIELADYIDMIADDGVLVVGYTMPENLK